MVRTGGAKIDVIEMQPMSRFRALWRESAPARVFQLYIALHLLVSFSYMYYFCRHWGFSRRLAVLHLSALSGPTLVIILMAGLLALLGRNGGRPLVRYGIAALYATWSIALALLYVAHFVGNSLWGDNVNYQIVAHYFLRRRITEDDGLSLSLSTYLILAVAALAIVAIHVALSPKILRGLEHLFLPERQSSIFHGRRRAMTSGLVLVLVLTAYAGYVHALPAYAGPDWSVELEPIVSFFQPDLYDMRHAAIADRLRVEEPRARASYPSGRTFKKKNVIIIIVDSLRPDHMQVYGYRRPTTPFLSSLAQSGRLKQVEFASSTCAESKCGILSTLASKSLPAIIPEDFKLHDLLHDQGYQSYFILSGDHEWYGLKKAYGKELTYFADNTTSEKYRGLADDRLIFDGLENVPDFTGTPAFFYFHLMSVHIAGVKHEEFRLYQPANVGRDWDALVHGNYDVTSLVNNYDNGVTEADAVIRQIFERLAAKGYTDQSLAVILSDHGEGLGERGPKKFGHVRWLYQELIRIPLLIYDDSNTSFANLKYATQVDIAPTIVDVLGLPIPESWQGQSLLRPDSRQYTFHQTSLMNPSYSVLYRSNGAFYQYLYRTQDRREELYDLVADKAGTNDLISTADRSMVHEFRARLEQYRAQAE